MKEDNLYSPSCRALVCVTFCMNVTAGPVLCAKEWVEHKTTIWVIFSFVHFFFLFAMQKEKTEPKKKNTLYQKRF